MVEAVEIGSGTLFEVVLAVLVALPFYVVVKAIAGAIRAILGPAGLPLVTLLLVFLIQFLSSGGSGAALSKTFSTAGSPESIHRAGGSPAAVGVALVLLLVIVLLYLRFSLLGGGDS